MLLTYFMKVSVCSSHSKWSFKYTKPLDCVAARLLDTAPTSAFDIVKKFPIHLPKEKMQRGSENMVCTTHTGNDL